jgi:acetyltransferase-like isoleucine patch superfamily enzyme
LVIGNYCSIAEGSVFILGGEHRTKAVSTFPFDQSSKDQIRISSSATYSKGDIEIGHDVWIGERSIVLSGVRIGHGAVIGAGSVISSNVPDYAIVVGNPAEIVKYRFSPDLIRKLLQIEWWHWPETLVLSNQDCLISNATDSIDKMQKLVETNNV